MNNSLKMRLIAEERFFRLCRKYGPEKRKDQIKDWLAVLSKSDSHETIRELYDAELDSRRTPAPASEHTPSHCSMGGKNFRG